MDLKIEDITDADERTISILIRATSEQGRLGLKKRNLKPEFQQLIDSGNNEVFIQKCGTHFVSLENRGNDVYILVNIKGLNSAMKKKLITDYRSGADFSIEDALSVNSKTSLSYKNFIDRASKFGKIEIHYNAVGTGGVNVLESLVKNLNPNNLDSILSALSEAIKTATKENAAPLRYHIAPMSIFGLKTPPFDNKKFEFISRLYKKLLVLNTRIRDIERLKDSRIQEFAYYYSAKLKEYQYQRQNLIAQLEGCANNGNCNLPEPEMDDTIIFPEDMLHDVTIEITSYYRDAVNSDGKKVGQLLDNVSFRCVGSMDHADYFSNMQFGYLDKENEIKLISFDNPLGTISLSQPIFREDSIQTKRFQVVIDSKSVRYNNFHANGEVLYSPEAAKAAQDLLESINNKSYVIFLRTTDGLKIANDLGFANLSQIPPYKKTK
jgi:hypothetical protein